MFQEKQVNSTFSQSRSAWWNYIIAQEDVITLQLKNEIGSVVQQSVTWYGDCWEKNFVLCNKVYIFELKSMQARIAL